MRLRAVIGGAIALGAAGALAPLFACNLGQGISDAGTDAAPESMGYQCQQVYTELCTQAIQRCGEIGFTLDQCVSSNMLNCPCPNGDCDAASAQAPSQVGICQQDIDSEDCNAIANSVVPSDCAPFTKSTGL